MSDEDLRSRLEALEARVDALTAAPAPQPAAEGDPFWVLNGIEQRYEQPGAVVYAGSVEVADGPVKWQIGALTDDVLAQDWSHFAPALAALGHPVRLQILQTVLGGVSTVAELAAVEGMGTTGQLYHHIHQLTAQGWLIAKGRGQYSIAPERIVPLMVIVTATRL